MKQHLRLIIGIGLITLGLLIGLFLLYENSPYSQVTRPFSPYSILTSSWGKYKTQFINQDGRVLDNTQDDITTSEGQSYAMLRAVWVDDKATFDQVWQWTSTTLNRPDDNLFGWRWGKRADQSYGFIEDGGENAASDADSDIALALILASRRWNDQKYLDQAKPILTDLWEVETATVKGQRYLIAGNWASNNNQIIINPSYFAPYAWRIFAEVDKEHDWASLIDPAYQLLNLAGQDKLDKTTATGLPPDWLAMNRQTGQISATDLPNLTTNYSYDAMRIPFRIALDYRWSEDPQARDYLAKSFQGLGQIYAQNGVIYAGYTHDGQSLDQTESPSMYSTLMGYFLTAQPDQAERIYQEKIIRLYSTAQDTFREELPYYDQNWLWFGTALYHNFLSDFTS